MSVTVTPARSAARNKDLLNSRDARGALLLDLGAEGNSGTHAAGGLSMGKGLERKKETKKKPAKNLMEKRAAKAEKRNQKKQWGGS